MVRVAGATSIIAPHMDDHQAGLPRYALLRLLGDSPAQQRVLALALPVLIQQLLLYGVGLCDTFLAGRIDSTATSAVGLAVYVGWLASLMFAMAVTGAAALMARHWGAGERSQANEIFNQSLALAACLGIAVFAVLYTAAPSIAGLQEMTGETGTRVVRYLRIDAFGHLFTSVTVAGAAALRSTGDMRSPMLIMGFVNVLNATISTALVYGIGPFPQLGVDGIVAGTVIARSCGAAITLAVFIRGLSGLRLDARFLLPRPGVVRRILRIGLPAGADGAFTLTAYFVFMMIIARLATGARGQATYAAHVIGIQIEALTYLPAVAWGTAAATLIGHALGRRDFDMARRVGHIAAFQCSLLACGASLTYYFGAGPIYRIMHTDELVRQIGVPALRFLAFFQISLVLQIVYVHALSGAGDTRSPMLFTLFSMFLVRLPLAYVCGILLHGGLIGAWIGMGSDVTLRAVLALTRYARGAWLDIKV